MSRGGCTIYLWKCTVCGKKHYGKNPPFCCKKCDSEANKYVLVPEKDRHNDSQREILTVPSLNSFLYLVGSTQDGKPNAMCCSSVTQVTYSPARIAVAVNKNNLTHDYIKQSGVFSLSLLGKSQSRIAHHFGRNSGKQINKFEQYNQKTGKTGSPIVEECPGYYDCQVDHSATIDLDSHSLFVANVVEASVDSHEPLLTYLDYLGDMSSS